MDILGVLVIFPSLDEAADLLLTIFLLETPVRSV
jgi:hypothetical protein